MGIGLSVLLLAAGAILAFAVDAEANGIDLTTVGVILMVAGFIGLVVDMMIFAPRRRSVTTVNDDPYARRTVRRDEMI